MQEFGLNGLVAVDERNVFYASNLWPLFSRMHRPHPTLVVIPRRAGLPVIAVAPATEVWTTARDGAEWPEMIVYTAPASEDDYLAYLANLPDARFGGRGKPPAGVGPGYWARRQDTRLSAYERRLEGNLGRYSANAAPSWQTGLARALAESGLTKGPVGCDSGAIAVEMREFLGNSVEFVPADNIFRKIRMVKSASEVAQMRVAAQANAAAVLATARQIRAGATGADVERIFLAEAGRRGAVPVFVILDTVGGLSRGKCARASRS